MPKFSADIRFLSNRYIPRRGNNAFFSCNLSTGTDLVTNFDLVKCIAKTNINSYPNYNRKVERGLFTRKVKYRHQQDILSMVYSRDIEVSFFMSCNLKVTQYMHYPTSQLYSIWMSIHKVLYR